jgi:hypothetical protein
MDTPVGKTAERHLHLYVGPASVPDKEILNKKMQETKIQDSSQSEEAPKVETPQTKAPNKELLNRIEQSTSRTRAFFDFLNKPQGRDSIKLIVLLILFHLTLSGHINQILAHVFHNDIYDFNSHYLSSASKESIKTLEVVAGIKSVLAILQSLSGGVSFIVDVEIQLGNSLSVLSYITDKAWAISLSSVGAAETLSLLHHSVYFTMKPILATLLFMLGLAIGLKRMSPTLSLRIERLITLGVFLAVFSHVIVPISIYGTAKISEHYLQPQKQQIHAEFSKLASSLPHHNEKSELKDQVSELRKHFKKGLKEHTNKTGDYSLLAVKHIIYNVTEFILIPIAILIFLSKLLMILIRKEMPHLQIKHFTDNS